MERFSYVDIYATKGIEYLLIIGFLLMLIAFWKYFTAPELKRMVERVGRGFADLVEWFLVPEGVYFHQGHAWAKAEDEDIVRIGIDDFAQRLVGKIDTVDMPVVGSTIRQGEKGWSIKLGDKYFD